MIQSTFAVPLAYARRVIAFLYIGGFMLAGFAVIAILWMLWPPLAGAFIGFLWFWAFRTPTSSDWFAARRLRKTHRALKDPK